jgi:hypothetical protein
VYGQSWIVDSSGVVRLWRQDVILAGREQAFVDEAVYKLANASR